MVMTSNFDTHRVWKYVEIPKIKEICPKEKLAFKNNNTVYMIYKDDDLTYPSIGEIDFTLSEYYHKPMIKCYIAKTDTADMLENLLSLNEKREDLEILIVELSKLHIIDHSKIKNLEDYIKNLKIDHDKIFEIFERYKNILAPTCAVYKFCYYWVILCIVLDIRTYKGKPTVIHRSLVVRDANNFIKGKITKKEYCTSWDDVKDSIDPSKFITDIKYIPVKGYPKLLRSDRFVNKKDQNIQVKPHGRIKIDTE